MKLDHSRSAYRIFYFDLFAQFALLFNISQFCTLNIVRLCLIRLGMPSVRDVMHISQAYQKQGFFHSCLRIWSQFY